MGTLDLKQIEDEDPVVPCALGAWRASLDPANADIFSRWLADTENLPAERLVKRVARAGLTISSTNMRNHRRGECAWCKERFE